MRSVAFLLLLAFAASVNAQEPAAPPPAVAEAEPAAVVAEPLSPVRQAYDRVLPALVQVRIDVLEDRIGAYQRRTPTESVFDEFVRQRVKLRLAGYRIDANGSVLVRDPNLPLKRYGDIGLLDHQGTVLPGRVAAILENHAAVLIEPVTPPKEPLPAISLSEALLKPGDSFLMASPSFIEKSLCLTIEREIATGTAVAGTDQKLNVRWWASQASGQKIHDMIPTTVSLILDMRALPIGVMLDNAMWETADGQSSWIGERIAADRRVTAEALTATADRIQARASESVKEIAVEFRSDSPLNQKVPLENGKFYLYGMLTDTSGSIFVPTEFGRDIVGQIANITVIDDDKAIEADFVGLFAQFGAFIIRAKGVSGKPADMQAVASLPRGGLFYTLSPQRRFGHREIRVEYNRYLDVASGYKELDTIIPQKTTRIGDWICDDQGRMLGFFAAMKREKEDELHARLVRGSRSDAMQARVFMLDEVLDAIRKPGPHFDPSAQPKSRLEERRFVWLGVEYQPMTAPIARALNVETVTRDGARGLLVTRVYSRSPAAELGIEVNDILLSVTAPGAPREFDLAPKGKWRNIYVAKGRSRRIWRPRRNYLTELLRLIGEGRTVIIRRWHAGAESTVSLLLENAPDDFDSAKEHTEPSLGVTVKPLTYEVRSVLRLADDAPGLVVSRVEPGSKAAVAQIGAHEIIASVNDRPVRSLEEFEEIVRNSAAAGRVELLLVYLGQSRIVEIDLDEN